MPYRTRVLPKKKSRKPSSAKERKAPYALPGIEARFAAPPSEEQSFFGLPRRALEGFETISSAVSFPKGAILFAEGQHPQGVFVIRNGRAKLTAISGDGMALLFRIAGPGDLIGLPATISGKPYELTAEALEPIQAAFVPQNPLLDYLRKHGDVAVRVAEILTEIYHGTYREARYLGLSGSATEKLARFLVDPVRGKAEKNSRIRVPLALTHQQIAGMIGTSRETVTRLIANFKRNRLIEIHGSTLVITNTAALMRFLET